MKPNALPNALIVLLGATAMGLYASTTEREAFQTEPGKPEVPPAQAAQSEADSTGSFRPGVGTVIVAELVKSLDAGKLKVDDKVACNLLQDLLFKGKIAIPREAKVWGHVIEVVRSSKTHPGSRVALVFDKVVLPNKKELPFQYPAVIVAVAAPIRGTTVQTTKLADMPVQMAKGKDTGGSVLGAVSSNSQLAGANMGSSKGAIGPANRGVIGIKNVVLDTSNAAYPVLVSPKGNLRLDFDVQLLLQVAARPKP